MFGATVMTQTPALKTRQLSIGGMDCTSCKLKIETRLERLNGVSEAAVTVATGRLVVSYNQTNLEKQRLQASIQQQVQTSERQFYTTAQQHATELVTKQRDIWIQQSLKEVLWWAAGGTMLVFTVGIALGTLIYQFMINNFTDTPWAVQLWQWNQPFYRECYRQNRTTCNFRIVPPEEK